jgi:hypothetical protein
VAVGSLEQAEFSREDMAITYATFSRLPMRGSLELAAALADILPDHRTPVRKLPFFIW